MKKTLLALTSALVLAGAMSSTASAQSSYYNVNDRNNNGVDDRYERADSLDGRYYDSRDQSQFDYDRDGVSDRNDYDDDNDGVSDRYDANDHDARDGRAYAQDGRYDGYDRDGRDGRYESRDGRDDRYDDRYDDRDGRNDRYGNRDGRHDNGKHKGWAKKRYHAGRYMAPRNYSYRQYQVGSRLPMGYYGSSHYVSSSPYGLQQPPRGYRWNRVGNDVYLVNTTNGVIRNVIYSLFY
jgi:Ni/Co efflux regulator RcnB